MIQSGHIRRQNFAIGEVGAMVRLDGQRMAEGVGACRFRFGISLILRQDCRRLMRVAPAIAPSVC